MSRGIRTLLAAAPLSVLSLMLVMPSRTLAQAAPAAISVDENGNGTIVTGAGTFPIAGTLQADPGPGGLTAALTYNLLAPPSLVAGDVILQESVTGGPNSEIIRFNPAGTGGANYPASLVFYSDNVEGVDALADTGFPTSQYTNVVSLLEVGVEGANGIVYTPTANQPGFITGFATTYNITSDSIPEPASLGLVGVGASSLLLRRRRVLA